MKILILGASGFLGGKIFNKIKLSEGFEVMGTYFQSDIKKDLIKVDITDYDSIKVIMREFDPDIILWSLMSCEDENRLIDLGIKNLLDIIRDNQKLTFLSSNAVFRGKKGSGNYKEEDEPQYIFGNDPLDLYANAKIKGELMIKKHKNSIIIRPGAIYGQDINGKWDARITELINKIVNRQEVIRAKNMYNTFVKVDELANAIIELIKIDYKGIIHLGPKEKESYFDYYKKTAVRLNLDSSLIKSNVISQRMDLSINTLRSQKLLGDIFTNV